MANLARNSTPIGTNADKSAFSAGDALDRNVASVGTNLNRRDFIERSRIWGDENLPWNPDNDLPWQDNEIIPEFDVDGAKITRNTAPSGTNLTRN